MDLLLLGKVLIFFPCCGCCFGCVPCRNAEFVRGLGNNRGLNMDRFALGGCWLSEVEEEMSDESG